MTDLDRADEEFTSYAKAYCLALLTNSGTARGSQRAMLRAFSRLVKANRAREAEAA